MYKMTFDAKKYINTYNKNTYKMYQFRVKKNNDLIKYLDGLENRNGYIISLLEKEMHKNTILSIQEIKEIITPILNKYGIKEIYLFGSYARNEANIESDVDIYCEQGNIKGMFDYSRLVNELEDALHKEVDVIFNTSKMDPYFEKSIMEEKIKLC